MAKKKAKQQSPKTIEGQIRTRARKLKIGTCYINHNWEEMRKATVIITREHTNDNITFGVFEMDLALLGVQEVIYEFNTLPDFLKELMKEEENLDFVFEEIDYEKAHNIIYGAVEFAEEYGFKPHASFATGRYILEEDTDHIPLMDIEMGYKGLPTVFADDEHPYTREIAILNETAGPGNYRILNLNKEASENGDYDIYDEILDIQDGPDLMYGWDDDIEAMGVPDWTMEQWKEYFTRDTDKISFRVLQYSIDISAYDTYVDSDLDAYRSVIGKNIEIVDQIELLSESEKMIFDEANALFEKGAFENAINYLKMCFRKHPESTIILLNILMHLSINKSHEEVVELYKILLNEFPDNLSLKCLLASAEFETENYACFHELFENKISMEELAPQRKTFTKIEVSLFCNIFIRYWLHENNLEEVEPYYQVMDMKGEDDYLTRRMLQEVVFRKAEYIQVINNQE